MAEDVNTGGLMTFRTGKVESDKTLNEAIESGYEKYRERRKKERKRNVMIISGVIIVIIITCAYLLLR